MLSKLFQAFEDAEPNHFRNPGHDQTSEEPIDECLLFTPADLQHSFNTITRWPGYSPTPLIELVGLARELGIGQLHLKDEGSRFGLGSFKALGGAYAVGELLNDPSVDSATITVTSATDGNHGLSVAWGASKLGCRCVIFIHADVSPGREQALSSQGATVVRIAGNYDDSVVACYEAAEANGWTVISDTARDESGSEVARTVMSGYSVMVREIIADLHGKVPSHVFIQGGVGGLAATVCEVFRLEWGTAAPRFIVVEPELAPCLFRSAQAGRRVPVEVKEETVMAGLSCGEVSFVAWPTLSRYADDFMTIPDAVIAPVMKLLAEAPFGDPKIVAGESAVAGLAGMICGSRQADLRRALQLNQDSHVLVIGTEGATDPALYAAMTGHEADSI